jgi:imidazolonepropionase-like amidohydrolase
VSERLELLTGRIDAHVHMMFSDIPQQLALTADRDYITPIAGRAAPATLLPGFTAVRDVSGPTFGLERAIDEGMLPGPRIWPSGASITQTAGHGDYGSAPHDLPAGPSRDPYWTERFGCATIADAHGELLRAVRAIMGVVAAIR